MKRDALGVSRLTSSEKPWGFGSRRLRTDVITRLLLNPGLRNSLLSCELPSFYATLCQRLNMYLLWFLQSLKKIFLSRAPLVVYLFCLIFKFKLFLCGVFAGLWIIWSLPIARRNTMKVTISHQLDINTHIISKVNHFPHVKTCKQQLIIIIRNNTLMIH